MSFDVPELDAAGLLGIGVTVDAPNDGTLHAKVFLRSFFRDGTKGDPEQMQQVVATPVAAGRHDIASMFDAALFNTHPLDMPRREVEMILIWQPANGNTALTLTAPPHPIPAD